MSIAALADVHGNIHALEAVLADPRCAEAELVVLLGDVVAGGFPAETFDRVRELGDRARVLRGNADRLWVEGAFEEEQRWAREQLGSERVEAVTAWPQTFVVEVVGLGAVRCCHATPRSDEEILTRITPEAEVSAAFAGTEEPVVIAGHTHMQFDRQVGPWRFVNAGSVGFPYGGGPGAYWALLGPDVEHVFTEYDVESAAAAVREVGHPRAEWAANVMLHPPSAEETTAQFEAMRGA